MKQRAKVYKGKRVVMGDKNRVTKHEIHVNDIPQQGGNSEGGGGDSKSSWRYFDVSLLYVDSTIMDIFHIVKCCSTKDGSIYIKSPNELSGYTKLAVGIDTSRLISSEVIGLSNGLITGEEFLSTDIGGFSVFQFLTEQGFAEITEEQFYCVLDGIYIQHIDGTLYTGDQWTTRGFGNDKINGIASINPYNGTNLIVAKNPIGEMPWSSIPNTLIEGVTTITEYDKVLIDRAGIKNSELIAAADPESAAAACANYTFPNGQKGHLATVREADSVKQCITSEIMKIIGVTIDDTILWTSTQCDATQAWYVNIGINDIYYDVKDKNGLVWPVCTLENFKFPQNV